MVEDGLEVLQLAIVERVDAESAREAPFGCPQSLERLVMLGPHREVANHPTFGSRHGSRRGRRELRQSRMRSSRTVTFEGKASPAHFNLPSSAPVNSANLLHSASTVRRRAQKEVSAASDFYSSRRMSWRCTENTSNNSCVLHDRMSPTPYSGQLLKVETAPRVAGASHHASLGGEKTHPTSTRCCSTYCSLHLFGHRGFS